MSSPFEDFDEDRPLRECPECGLELDVDEFCAMCSQAAGEFEEMAHGSPTREELGYPAASDDLPVWLP